MSLLDGGLDAHGRPWFAMEYVEGVELREWIERSGADARTLLEVLVWPDVDDLVQRTDFGVPERGELRVLLAHR